MAGEHAASAAHAGGLTVVLAVLVGVVSARPRVFAAVLGDAAVADRLGRSSPLGGAVSAGPIAWPVVLTWAVPRAFAAAAGPVAVRERRSAAGTAGALAGRRM